MMNAEYSRRIRKLREVLRLTQHALAELLHVRPPVVASWEQGRKVPSASNCRKLASLASPKDAWFFLEQIGVTKKLVRAKWPGSSLPRSGKKPASRTIKARVRPADLDKQLFVKIPLLRDKLSAGPRVLTKNDTERVLHVSVDFVSVKSGVYWGIRQRGDSMTPALQDGFIAVVDPRKRDARKLAGQLIAAWGNEGLVLRWLAPESRSGHLILRPENPQAPTLALDDTAGDRILGKVVSWWGMQG